MHPTHPLCAVREAATFVTERAQSVAVHEEALDTLAARIADGAMAPVAWDEVHHFRDGGPATAQYLLVLDALNFCFWPEPAWDYNRLAGSLKRTMLDAPKRFEAGALERATESDVREMLGGADDVPLLPPRAALVREVGAVLAARWGGEAANLVTAARGSAAALVALVTAELPGFRDHAIYRGHFVPLYKRAQIFVGDLWGSFEGRGLGRFDDLDQLTMFADYRIPQLLRAESVLEYHPGLAHIVDAEQELPSGSPEEVEIRAATIHAVERLRAGLARRRVVLSSVELDWILWNVGEARQGELGPHHRTLTIFY